MDGLKNRSGSALPKIAGIGVLGLFLVGGVGYNLQQVRSLQTELMELRTAVERANARPATATAPVTAAPARTAVAAPAEIESLRDEVSELRREWTGWREQQASPLALSAAPAGDAVGSAPASEPATTPAPKAVGRILATLESQDQTLLKGVVKEILELNESEEREARRKRQAEEMTRQYAQTLSLTPQQLEKVTAITMERMAAMETLRASSNDGNREEMRTKFEEIRKQGEAQIAQLLTAEQLAKFQEILEQRGSGRNDGAGGPGGFRGGGGSRGGGGGR